MHLCMDKFVMADFDIEEGQELEVSDLFCTIYLDNQHTYTH